MVRPPSTTREPSMRTPAPRRSSSSGTTSTSTDPSLTVTAKTDPSHGTLTLIAGVLTYTPDADFHGTDAFDYTVSDGTSSDTGHVTITVTPVNDPPVAVDDAANMTRGSRTQGHLGPRQRRRRRWRRADRHGQDRSGPRHPDPRRGRPHLHADAELLRDGRLHLHDQRRRVHRHRRRHHQRHLRQRSAGRGRRRGHDHPRHRGEPGRRPHERHATSRSTPCSSPARPTASKGNVVITGGGTGLTYDPFTGYLRRRHLHLHDQRRQRWDGHRHGHGQHHRRQPCPERGQRRDASRSPRAPAATELAVLRERRRPGRRHLHDRGEDEWGARHRRGSRPAAAPV